MYGRVRVGRGAVYVTTSAFRGPKAASSSTAPRSRDSTSGTRDGRGSTRANFTARRPPRVGPVQTTYVVSRPSSSGRTGASPASAPVGPQRRSSVRERQRPLPSRTETPQGCPSLPQVTTARPLRSIWADSRRPSIASTRPKRTVDPHSPPAIRIRAARRLPARHTSRRSPCGLIATAADLATARSRAGPKSAATSRSATRKNGERSTVQAAIASPASLTADQWRETKSSRTENGPKPPSDWPSATTSRRWLVLVGASRATSSARVLANRWICASAGSTSTRSGGRSQLPVGSRVARPPKTGGSWPCWAPFQLSSPWPWASNASLCSSATPVAAGIASSFQVAACAGAAPVTASSRARARARSGGRCAGEGRARDSCPHAP